LAFGTEGCGFGSCYVIGATEEAHITLASGQIKTGILFGEKNLLESFDAYESAENAGRNN
jgi:hypothetical protein